MSCGCLDNLVEFKIANTIIGGGSTTGASFTRGTALPAATTQTLFWLNRQSTNQGDILYAAMQKSDTTWDWVQIGEAP